MPRKGKQVKSNRICFTLNNPTEEECNALKEQLEGPFGTHLEFGIAGKERGAQGTPHLQGFLHARTSFLRAKDGLVTKWKSLIPSLARAHLENAYGSDLDSEKYCSKEGDLLCTVGKPSSKASSPFAQMFAVQSLEEAVETDPEIALKYLFQIKGIIKENHWKESLTKLPTIDTLRPWQEKVLTKLEQQTDRQILFVVDTEGGKGKSTLAKHLMQKGRTFMTRGGKLADIAHAWTKAPEHDTVIFDMARCTGPEYWPYMFMEQLKDGIVFTSKYDSATVVTSSKKIIVLCNEEPNRDKLSSDRYCVFKI